MNALNRVESGLSPVEPGYPLLRDTLNGFAGLIFFWNKDFKLGHLVERWILAIQAKRVLLTVAVVCVLRLAVGVGAQPAEIRF